VVTVPDEDEQRNSVDEKRTSAENGNGSPQPAQPAKPASSPKPVPSVSPDPSPKPVSSRDRPSSSAKPDPSAKPAQPAKRPRTRRRTKPPAEDAVIDLSREAPEEREPVPRRTPRIQTTVRPAPSAAANEPTYLDLGYYLEIIWRRRKWVLAAVAVMVGLALGYSLLAPPTYTSTSKVLVRPINVDPVADPEPVDLETQRELVLSTAVARVAGPAIGAGLTAPEVLKHVSVDIPGETQVLTITYAAGDPREAQEGSRAVAQAYLDYRRQQAEAATTEIQERIARRMEELQLQYEDLTSEIRKSSDPTARAERVGVRAELLTLRTRLVSLTTVNRDPGDVIGAAPLSSSPASPNLLVNVALGLFLGLLGGSVLALVRARMDRRFRGDASLEHTLGVPTLALIPRVPLWHDEEEDVLISKREPQAPAVEAYRTLRTYLMLSAAESDRDSEMIMITSPLPGEGKTVTVANLGVVLAQSGRPTILVSADLRRPRLHRFFDLPEAPGLGDVLAKRARLRDAIKPSGVENLWVLTSGDVDPSQIEMLQPLLMRRLAKACQAAVGHFDFMLIDAPPLLPVADTLGMIPAMDEVLLLVDAHKTEEGAVLRSRQLLEQVDANILGGVLNRYEPDGGSYESYGYGDESLRDKGEGGNGVDGSTKSAASHVIERFRARASRGDSE
jgi:succinoglycan biosynthesis transport protein ExoP